MDTSFRFATSPKKIGLQSVSRFFLENLSGKKKDNFFRFYVSYDFQSLTYAYAQSEFITQDGDSQRSRTRKRERCIFNTHEYKIWCPANKNQEEEEEEERVCCSRVCDSRRCTGVSRTPLKIIVEINLWYL